MAEGYDGEIAFVHYARTPDEACYRAELAAHAESGCCTATPAHPAGSSTGHFGADHLQAAMADPDAVYVCGPPALVDAVRAHLRQTSARRASSPPRSSSPTHRRAAGSRFSDSGIDAAPMTAARCSSRPRPPD